MRPSQMKIFKANEELAELMSQDNYTRVAPYIYYNPDDCLYYPTDEHGAYFRKGFETINDADAARIEYLKNS
jgi:hypothetical protein